MGKGVAALVLIAAMGALVGAGMLMWFVVHLWVAMRTDNSLNRGDYIRAGIALVLVAGGIATMLRVV
jgi:hypothetical protein